MKLNWDKVDRIRKGETVEGVSKRTLQYVRQNKTWHDPNYIPKKKVRRGEDCPWAKLNWDIVNFMRNAYLNKTTKLSEIHDLVLAEFGVCCYTKYISLICLNKRWYNRNYPRNRKVGEDFLPCVVG